MSEKVLAEIEEIKTEIYSLIINTIIRRKKVRRLYRLKRTLKGEQRKLKNKHRVNIHITSCFVNYQSYTLSKKRNIIFVK